MAILLTNKQDYEFSITSNNKITIKTLITQYWDTSKYPSKLSKLNIKFFYKNIGDTSRTDTLKLSVNFSTTKYLRWEDTLTANVNSEWQEFGGGDIVGLELAQDVTEKSFSVIIRGFDLTMVTHNRYLTIINPTMYIISEEDRNALANDTTAIATKVIVLATGDKPEIVLTEENSIKDWEHNDERYVPNTGFIGQFVSRTLKGNLQDISDDFNIEDREIELQIGVIKLGAQYEWLGTENGDILIDHNGNQIYISEIIDSSTDWYSLGNFFVTKPEGDEVNDNTTFNAMDYATNFNADFSANYTSSKFPTSFTDTIKNGGHFTAFELAQYTCEQVNVDFGNLEFTNDDFIIDTNQFTEGNSCRDVMKEISKLAYGWCAIHWDNRCYIDEVELTPSTSAYNILTNDNYYSLKTQKKVYGPLNRIVLGSSSVEGQESVVEDSESMTQYGLTEIDIYDNPILYNETLQEQAKTEANRLLGLTYTPLTTETPGHPWLVGNELITIYDMENNPRYTYPFNRIIKYNGHIRTTLANNADTKQAVLKAFKRAIFKEIRDVHVQVNKQTGEIEELSSKLRVASDGLESVENTVRKLTTETYTKTEIQEIVKGIGTDGTVVSSVNTTTGTFDKDGLTIEQNNADTKTNINATGMYVYNTTGVSEDPVLTANATGVVAKNIRVRQYLNIGSHSRVEDYTHTDGSFGTGVFWIGSDL